MPFWKSISAAGKVKFFTSLQFTVQVKFSKKGEELKKFCRAQELKELTKEIQVAYWQYMTISHFLVHTQVQEAS